MRTRDVNKSVTECDVSAKFTAHELADLLGNVSGDSTVFWIITRVLDQRFSGSLNNKLYNWLYKECEEHGDE